MGLSFLNRPVGVVSAMPGYDKEAEMVWACPKDSEGHGLGRWPESQGQDEDDTVVWVTCPAGPGLLLWWWEHRQCQTGGGAGGAWSHSRLGLEVSREVGAGSGWVA